MNPVVLERSTHHRNSPSERYELGTEDHLLQQTLEIFDFNYPLQTKKEGTIRVFYNNCNSLEINNTIGVYLKQKKDKQRYNYMIDVEAPTKLDSIIRQMKIWEVDVCMLAETCVAWDKKIPRRVIRDITKQYDRTGSWTIAHSAIDIGSFFKPGGAGLLAMGNCNGMILDRGVDMSQMGRWAYTLIGSPQRKHMILFITGYRTGYRTGSPGEKIAWAQQVAMLRKAGREENPYDAFLIDLRHWINTYKTEEMEIVLCLDANEQWGKDAKITNFAQNLDLKNVNQEFQLADTHPNIANVQRSTTIDFCLCSPNILEYVRFAASTPYDLETLGDHRGMVIDIDIVRMFGEQVEKDTIQQRKLIMSNPKAVEKYMTLVVDKFEKQNIFKRSAKLLQRVNQGHTDLSSIMRQYEALDKEVFGICSKAEQKCKPTIAGRYEWSPTLVQAIKQLRYWRQRLRHNHSTPLIEKLGTELQIKYIKLAREIIQQHVECSKAYLKEVQTEARKYRQDHLEEVAQQYAEQHQMSKQQAIIELISHEETRNLFKNLQYSLKQNNRRPLKSLWVSVDENGQYTKDQVTKKVYTDTTEIHRALLNRNSKHLSQASMTPFAQGALRKNLKWDSTGKLAEGMLTGSVLNDQRFTTAMQLYLECLKTRDLSRLNTITPSLDLEEYAIFWKKKRETTVTSPFGLHIGHYKAALHNYKILNVHRALLLIPFKTGMVPSRWRRTVQTMLEKEPGAPWIHRLRIIELFDAQANAGFQIFVGRNMMRKAVQENWLQEESFGSTPGKMATSAILQKVLAIDQLRIERRAGGIFDCDASGCYDRILPPLASVHLQALGLHRTIGIFLARLMFQAKRYVKTAQGVSRQNIRTTKNNILHGIGQGNGGGPAMWISHLTVMFAAISSVCMGFAFSCVEGIKSLCTVGTGYVDDVTLGLSVALEHPQTEKTVYKHIKRMGQLWEKLLFITGGRLELSKCFWVPITWKWNGGIPRLVKKSRFDKEMLLYESETKEQIPIPRNTANDSVKRLGVWSTCDGTWKTEVRLWLEYSKEFSSKINRAGLSRQEGYLAYHAMWIAKFRYSASVISYSLNQLKEIQSSIMGACLSAAGYCKKMPRAVVYGPTSWGGMEWDNILVLSLYEKLKLLIGSIRLDDKVGQLIKVQLSWLQLFSGSSTPLLELKTSIPYLPKGWLTNIHQLLVETGIQVELSSGWIPTIQREEDQVLMDIVHNKIPEWAWAGINRCRLYLKVNTITDIVTLDGKYIPADIRMVKRKLRESALNFPLQLRPNKDDIEQWTYLLGQISSNGHLFTPLGKWLRSPDQIFQYVIAKDRDIIYRKIDSSWMVYVRKNRNSKRYRKIRLTTNTIPPDCFPVKVISTTSYLVVVNEMDNQRLEFTPAVGIYSRRQHICKQNVIGQYQLNTDAVERLKCKWHQPECRIVCATDGGLKDQIGSSSYGIFFPDEESAIVSGRASEYQPWTHASSTRQELLGQLGIEYWMDTFQSQWGVPRHKLKVTLITDSQASIDIITNMADMIGIRAHLKPEIDVALELYRLRLVHNWILWDIQKVESHIEVERAPNEFYWMCNAFVDDQATKAREDTPLEILKNKEVHILPGAQAGCKISGNIENNSLYTVLKQTIQGWELKMYLIEKYNWTEDIFSQINWIAHSRAFNKMARRQKTTLIKYVHGWLATNKRRFREYRVSTDKCLLCGHSEHRDHIFHCRNETMRSIREKAWSQYISEITQVGSPAVQAVFLSGMATIIGADSPDEDTRSEWPVDIRKAYSSQEAIGWDQVLYGRISIAWELCLRKSGEEGQTVDNRWTTKAIQRSWQFGLELWAVRNKLVHGSTGGVSQLELLRVTQLVQIMNRELVPRLDPNMRQVVLRPESDLLALSYPGQLAWLGKLKFLCPIWYRELEVQKLNIISSLQERDHQAMAQTNTNII